jgi:hypothetical protein
MKPKLDTLEDKIVWAKQHGYDCIVQCKTCGKTQYLEFRNGLRNGWSLCCNYTMPIIWQQANIDKAVGDIVKEAFIKGCLTPLKEPVESE